MLLVSYESESKVWLARILDLGWQPNLHEEAITKTSLSVFCRLVSRGLAPTGRS